MGQWRLRLPRLCGQKGTVVRHPHICGAQAPGIRMASPSSAYKPGNPGDLVHRTGNLGPGSEQSRGRQMSPREGGRHPAPPICFSAPPSHSSSPGAQHTETETGWSSQEPTWRRRGSVQGTPALAMHSWAQLAPAGPSEAPPPDPCPGTKYEVRQGRVPEPSVSAAAPVTKEMPASQCWGAHSRGGGGRLWLLGSPLPAPGRDLPRSPGDVNDTAPRVSWTRGLRPRDRPRSGCSGLGPVVSGRAWWAGGSSGCREWGDEGLGTISLRHSLETPLCSQRSLPVLFVHVVPGQVLEGLVQQDDRQ